MLGATMLISLARDLVGAKEMIGVTSEHPLFAIEAERVRRLSKPFRQFTLGASLQHTSAQPAKHRSRDIRIPIMEK